jgi:hypothetical protein
MATGWRSLAKTPECFAIMQNQAGKLELFFVFWLSARA